MTLDALVRSAQKCRNNQSDQLNSYHLIDSAVAVSEVLETSGTGFINGCSTSGDLQRTASTAHVPNTPEWSCRSPRERQRYVWEGYGASYWAELACVYTWGIWLWKVVVSQAHSKAFLAYGTHNWVKSNSILKLKAGYYQGTFHKCVCYTELHFRNWSTSCSTGKKFKTGSMRHSFTLDFPEPLVHFALCSGAYSDPAVRAYTGASVFHDLKLAKRDLIQANVYIENDSKVFFPKILDYFAKDMSVSDAWTVGRYR